MKKNQSADKRDNKSSPKPIPVTHENLNRNEKSKQTIKDTKAQ